MANVTLDHIDKIYPGGVKAVDNVSLEIRDQEFVVLVGPSGCGKTTTLRMIAGLEEITAGTIRIGDRVVNDVAPKDRDIAMVFQNYALYPHMSVYKNLAFALKLRKVSKKEIDERVNWAAQTLGIEELLDRRPRQLSGGQRQRVAVGRAIVREPKVFLFDEPLSNLDAKLRVTTRAELKKLQQSLKTTTVYVTHDQEEAMTLGDRVVVMHGGKIHQCGSPLEVYRYPVNRFVAGFVGMPPMNFIEGNLTAEGTATRFEGGGVQAVFSGTRFAKLSAHQGESVAIGIRPECLTVRPAGDSVENNGQAIELSAQVDVVEMLGHAMDLFVTVKGGQHLVCRTATDDVQVGEQVRLVIKNSDIHVFADDAEGCGANLAQPSAA
jgi:multiple sugar transport system ATP-binding protein